jgi:hypothetical protein
MYHFSRSIYRELAPRVIEDARDPQGSRNKQSVLDACEAAIRRLTYDGRYFARPARSLFNEVRPYFGMNDQLFVWRVVETNMRLATEFLARLPAGVGLDGRPPQCNALTRRGTPCQRTPLPGREYCPSHKHLEEVFPDAEPARAERDHELSALATA